MGLYSKALTVEGTGTVATSKNIIELNGQLYDAVTGKRVATAAAQATVVAKPAAQHSAAQDKPARHHAKQSASSTGNLDGVSRVKQRAAPAAHPLKPAAHTHRRAQHSKTLMRTVVKKPAAITPLKRAAPAPKPVIAKSTLVHSPSHDTFVKPERVIRSMGITKSSQITRFGAPAATVKAAALPVAPAPPAGKHHQAPALTAQQHTTSYVHQAPAASDPFTAALSQATSHDQPRHKPASRFSRTAARLRMKPRTLAVSGSALLLLLVTGVLIQHNAPYVAMKVAASRSGVDATLPKYQPAGFSMERPIDYNPGQVSVTYKSNSDSRDFKLVQRASSWNSDELLANVVGNQEHQVYQASGRTIYIYDNNTATWVDGGVWYKIEGNASLSSDQLRKIVDSL